MKSPIARGLIALARMLEWGHRRIHGPEYAPGDVVALYSPGRWARGTEKTLDCRVSYGWASIDGHRIHEDEIIRVVRYGEGE